jgi:uncharacterized membrane-anchored protein
MEKMSLSELDGDLEGNRVRLSAVVTEAIGSLVDFVETQFARFGQGGDLADRGVEESDSARFEYLFNNTDESVRTQLLAGMDQSLSAVKTRMDQVVDKAGMILQENVARMTDVVFPEHVEGQEKSLDEFKEVKTKLESVQVAVETKNSALLPLLIITLLVAGADLVLNILRILGVL